MDGTIYSLNFKQRSKQKVNSIFLSGNHSPKELNKVQVQAIVGILKEIGPTAAKKEVVRFKKFKPT